MVRLIPHGVGIAIPVPLEIARRYGLKAGQYVHVLGELTCIRIKKSADAIEQLKDDPESYEDYRNAMELAQLENPELVAFWHERGSKK